MVAGVGESGIGSVAISPPACEGGCAQPFPYHISYCGDIDLVGLRKPQSYYRSVHGAPAAHDRRLLQESVRHHVQAT